MTIEKLFADEFAFVDDCLALAARQVEVLGEIAPTSVEDVAQRDLNCDTFEFLYEARKVIAENRPSVVFPAMRRAFESISLCLLFTVKPEFAREWCHGREFSSGEVRKHLDGAPMTESIEKMREEYRHFSRGTHPNRTHLPYVFLGEGNKFTLGSIPPIDSFDLGAHIRHLISLSYWYVGVFLYFFKERILPGAGRQFSSEFVQLTPRVIQLLTTLDRQLAALHRQKQQEPLPAGLGPAFFSDQARLERKALTNSCSRLLARE